MNDERKPRCEKTGKVKFLKRDAQSKVNQLVRLGVEKYLRAYHCPDCNFHHLTKVQHEDYYDKKAGRHFRKNTVFRRSSREEE
jgi:hypothetical protein